MFSKVLLINRSTLNVVFVSARCIFLKPVQLLQQIQPRHLRAAAERQKARMQILMDLAARVHHFAALRRRAPFYVYAYVLVNA